MAARTTKPLRRRAKQSRSRVTVEAILEAATRVLLTKGYAHATTNKIAERAGVSVGTLYQYFDGKDQIFEELFRRDATILIGSLAAEEIDPRKPLEFSLLRILNNLLTVLPHFPDLLRQLEAAPNSLLRRRIVAHEQQLLAGVRRLLEVYRTTLCVDDLDLAAFVIVHASEGIAVSAGVEFSVERLAIELSKMFARYLSSVE
jgi:AcrR family transcriptional regulator